MDKQLFVGALVLVVFLVIVVVAVIALAGREIRLPAWHRPRWFRSPWPRSRRWQPTDVERVGLPPDPDGLTGKADARVPTTPPRPRAPQRIEEPAGYRPGRTAVQAPPAPAAPAVRAFVIDAERDGRVHEPRLPARVVAGGGWHDSFFHGWCGAADGPRPLPRLVVRAAALRGASHANLGTEGQDAIGAAWDDRHRALYVAVADGLGSLPQSGRVATEAINAALHLCAKRPDGVDFNGNGQRLFEAIAAGLRRTFNPADAPLDGACTLVVAEVLPRADGAYVTVHGVGDSEAWLLFDGDWQPLHHERRDRDNATRELPTHVRPNTESFQVPPGSVLLLGSDGFAGALDTSVSPLARGLAEYWRSAPSWVEFVNHVNFVDDYWSDDRAAVAVWIGEGARHG